MLDLDDPQLGLDDSYFLWKKYSEDGNESFGWAQILPQVKTAFELSRFSIYIMGLILFGIVALGIINTLFMSLYERMFEFGVLRAIGTRPFGIGQMIVYEAAALAVLSIVLGSILGLIITYATALVGFDFRGIDARAEQGLIEILTEDTGVLWQAEPQALSASATSTDPTAKERLPMVRDSRHLPRTAELVA